MCFFAKTLPRSCFLVSKVRIISTGSGSRRIGSPKFLTQHFFTVGQTRSRNFTEYKSINNITPAYGKMNICVRLY